MCHVKIFGGVIRFPDGMVMSCEGLWEPDFAVGGTNLREAKNQVNHLLHEIRMGMHNGCKVWVATNNSVWLAIWNKGSSSAQHLFYLVLALKQEARKHEVFLHCFHISGDRTITSGVDELSHGNYDAGILLHIDVQQFLQMNISAWVVAGNVLEDWCKSWMGIDYAPLLTPKGWFEHGQPGVHIWTLPPVAMLIALKELLRFWHQQPSLVTHVVLIPQLLWDEEWCTHFEKEVDIWFILHNGSIWPHCENIHSGISLSGDLVFSHQQGIYGLNSQKGFGDLFQRSHIFLNPNHLKT
jgi:hypothetical protein